MCILEMRCSPRLARFYTDLRSLYFPLRFHGIPYGGWTHKFHLLLTTVLFPSRRCRCTSIERRRFSVELMSLGCSDN